MTKPLILFLALTPVLHAQDLDLSSRVLPLPAANRFAEDGYFVWCGAPVKCPDEKYHLFYSRWSVKHRFAPGWAIHSEIAYAVADKPADPYHHVNVALPPRGINPATGTKYWDADVAHNANAFFHNGKYHLSYTGNYGDCYYSVARDVVGTFSGAKGGLCMFQSEDGLNWKPSKHAKVLGETYPLDDGSMSTSRIERPFLLLENDEPIYLFGAADGYLKNGRISTNAQFPIAPVK